MAACTRDDWKANLVELCAYVWEVSQFRPFFFVQGSWCARCQFHESREGHRVWGTRCPVSCSFVTAIRPEAWGGIL